MSVFQFNTVAWWPLTESEDFEDPITNNIATRTNTTMYAGPSFRLDGNLTIFPINYTYNIHAPTNWFTMNTTSLNIPSTYLYQNK